MPDLVITGQTPGPCGCCGEGPACPDCNFVGVFESTEEYEAEAALFQYGENWIVAQSIAAAWTDPSYTPLTDGYSFAGTVFGSPDATPGAFARSQMQLAAGVLSLDFDISLEANQDEIIQVDLRLFACDGVTLIDSATFASSVDALTASDSLAVTVPADGQYRVEVSISGGRGSIAIPNPECDYSWSLEHESPPTFYPVCYDIVPVDPCLDIDCGDCDPEMCGQEGNFPECEECCCD